MTRTVRQINTKPGRSQDKGPRPFSDFGDTPCLVLLGDPGAGKTHVFTHAAKADGARFIKARAFLSLPASTLAGQPLFIDGLDEQRAGRSDRGIIDALVAKLFEVNQPKVRVSCRVADWLGDSDLAGLQPFFDQHGETAVLLLQSLDRAEQLAVLAAMGVQPSSAEAFLDEAAQRGLDDFFENPQNLRMLWRAVQAGDWPETRSRLFDTSASLLLQEFDDERARAGSGSFAAAELRPAAGALCAARLISDITAISLKEQEGTPDIPGYRSLVFMPKEKVLAVLGRRIFDAVPETETVDYSHRTMAEYLAAEFLAARVRAGLPFGRVQALIGADGHPAAELRGLHAWLTVHLPERAEELIEVDPYGVLTYGDAAGLSPSTCISLIRALDRLSAQNPWFRSGGWEARTIGGLSRPDMTQEFRAILNNPASGFGVRSVVVDALMLGGLIPEMVPDLAAVLVRQASPFAERVHALAALLRYGTDGATAVQQAFSNLGATTDGLRLRSEIIRALYGRPYGAAEVVALLNDTARGGDKSGAGLFWQLADLIPIEDLPAILDGVVPIDDRRRGDRHAWESGSFYARLLVRAWRGLPVLDPERTIAWLRKRAAFKGGTNETRARDLRAAMREAPERLLPLAQYFLRNIPVDKDQWLHWQRFRETLLHELSAVAWLSLLQEELLASPVGSERRGFLYHLSFSLCYQADEPYASEAFAALYALADGDATLASLRTQATFSNLPSSYFAGRTSEPQVDVDESREQQRQQFDREVEQIRSGLHVGWMLHLMRFYFAFYDEADRAAAPRARLVAWIGDERLEAALQGFKATLSRDDVPTTTAVLASAAKRMHSDWWYVLSAGLSERLAARQDFSGLSDDFLAGMLIFDVANPVAEERDGTEQWVMQPWRNELTLRRPQFVRDAYIKLAKLHLGKGGQHAEALHELLGNEAFAAYRRDTVLDLLGSHPNAHTFDLAKMLRSAQKLPAAHDALLALCRTQLAGHALAGPQRDLWLVAAFALAPKEFESEVKQRAMAHPSFVFDLRDQGTSLDQEASAPAPVRSLQEMEFLATLTGTLFPDAPHPSGVWDGDRNAWDAAGWVRGLINAISSSTADFAGEALERLKNNADIASYRPHILHAYESQKQRRREASFERPDWPQTVAALDNGPPATVADLHALLVAQLRDARHRIQRTNTDIFKYFWNVDSYNRPEEPRPEEACRDAFIDVIRPTLQPLGIAVEPEAHMAGDKRADMSVVIPGGKILCEWKRDYHAKVWTAIEGQLERFYAHDPDAKGFGVFGVFWFGDKRPQVIPAPPNGMQRPQSAAEMERMLIELTPTAMRYRLAVIVMDVSGDF